MESYKAFQLLPGSYSLKEYDIANYNIGYCYFQLKGAENYKNANISFRKYLTSKNTDDALKVADANVRTGDCYYVDKVFASAAEYYETAIALNKIDVDYSIYQKQCAMVY